MCTIDWLIGWLNRCHRFDGWTHTHTQSRKQLCCSVLNETVANYYTFGVTAPWRQHWLCVPSGKNSPPVFVDILYSPNHYRLLPVASYFNFVCPSPSTSYLFTFVAFNSLFSLVTFSPLSSLSDLNHSLACAIVGLWISHAMEPLGVWIATGLLDSVGLMDRCFPLGYWYPFSKVSTPFPCLLALLESFFVAGELVMNGEHQACVDANLLNCWTCTC